MQARHDDVVAAFYTRVMQRVCTAYRDLDPKENAHVTDVIAQRWSHRVTCYTGIAFPDTLSSAVEIDIDAPPAWDDDAAMGSRVADDPDSTEANAAGGGGDNNAAAEPAATVEAAPVRASERGACGAVAKGDGEPPSAAHAGAGAGDPATHVMGTKRKIAQVDGSIDDESDAANGDDDVSAVENDAAPPRDFGPLTTPTSDVVAMLAPAWSLPVTGFPTQLSARFSKFALRSRQRNFYGKLSAIILTLTRPIVATDVILPGHVLWMYGVHQSSDSSNAKDEMVQVVYQQRRVRSDEIHVMLADGAIVVVPKSRTRRFYEVLVAKGTVRFNLSGQH